MDQSVVNEMFKSISIKEGLLPLKVTPFYHRKIKEEVEALGNYLGPLHRVSFPTQDRLLLRAPNEVKDFVDDRSNAFGRALKTSIVRKYVDRILFLTTSECFGNCQYCFRTDVLTESSAPDKRTGWLADLRLLREYLGAHPEVTEVILSGGDPLILRHPDWRTSLRESVRFHRSSQSEFIQGLLFMNRKPSLPRKLISLQSTTSVSSFISCTHMKSAKTFLKKSKNFESARSGSTTNFRCCVTRMTTIWYSISSWRCSTRWAYAISRFSFQIPSTSPRHSACA